MANRVLLETLLLGNVITVYFAFGLQRLAGEEEYEAVYPRKLYTRHRRNADAKFPNEVQYGFKVQGEDIVMHLERNDYLFATNYTQTHYSRDGKEITTSPVISDHCYYLGYIMNESASEASISVCDGIRGYFKTKGQRYLINPLRLAKGEEHALYKYEISESGTIACGVKTTTWEGNRQTYHAYTAEEKEEFLKEKKYIELFMVADKSIYIKYSQHRENVLKRIFEVVNYVNMVYKAINTFVALIGTEIWNKEDQIDMTGVPKVVLGRFAGWRRDNLLRRIWNDNAQLLTNIDFPAGTVGIAYTGVMCSTEESVGINKDQADPSSVGTTMAHEMGHNIGMKHDEDGDCVCPEAKCIMIGVRSPYEIPRTFSSCSLKAFDSFILSIMPECMRNKPFAKDLKTPAVCGNGFTETGEDCDCGTAQECKNPCCEAAKCKLKPEVMCADGECCEKCQIKKRGVVCRLSKGECDLPDVCNGKHAVCPSDRFRVNGLPCNKDLGYCHFGTCPTLLNQCIDLWGPSVKLGPDKCFEYNLRGVYYGFCKYSNGSFISCKPKDVKCGKLFCSGGSSLPTVSAGIVSFRLCKTIYSGEEYMENFSIARTGTKCGNELVCNLNKCVSVESVYKSANCIKTCTGHGVCDHENLCLCKEGWSGPKCDQPNKVFIPINFISLDSSSNKLLLIGYILFQWLS